MYVRAHLGSGDELSQHWFRRLFKAVDEKRERAGPVTQVEELLEE
jgi:hypothetical protein